MGKKGSWVEQSGSVVDNPFALLRKGSVTPTQGIEAEAEVEEQRGEPTEARVWVERKGRAGKTVTLVSAKGLDAKLGGEWCRAMRESLGCGGSVERERRGGEEEVRVLLQGEQRERAGQWLAARGLRVKQ